MIISYLYIYVVLKLQYSHRCFWTKPSFKGRVTPRRRLAREPICQLEFRIEGRARLFWPKTMNYRLYPAKREEGLHREQNTTSSFLFQATEEDE